MQYASLSFSLSLFWIRKVILPGTELKKKKETGVTDWITLPFIHGPVRVSMWMTVNGKIIRKPKEILVRVLGLFLMSGCLHETGHVECWMKGRCPHPMYEYIWHGALSKNRDHEPETDGSVGYMLVTDWIMNYSLEWHLRWIWGCELTGFPSEELYGSCDLWRPLKLDKCWWQTDLWTTFWGCEQLSLCTTQ